MAHHSRGTSGSVTGLHVFTDAVMSEYSRMFSKCSLDQVRDDVATRCIERWLTLHEDEKAVFVNKAKAIAQASNSTSGVEGEHVETTFPSVDESKSMTAYLQFCEFERPRVMRHMPHATLGAVNKELVRRWTQRQTHNSSQASTYNSSSSSTNSSRPASDGCESDIDVESIETDTQV